MASAACNALHRLIVLPALLALALDAMGSVIIIRSGDDAAYITAAAACKEVLQPYAMPVEEFRLGEISSAQLTALASDGERRFVAVGSPARLWLLETLPPGAQAIFCLVADEMLSPDGAGVDITGVTIRIPVGRWIRRLNQLVLASDGISAGNFNIKVADSSNDEIGQLCDAFEGMRKAIKQRDGDLHKLNASLLDQVKERTAALEAERNRAEAANVAKSEFLASMSHELRTPLHGILSFAGIGTRKYRQVDPEKILNYFQKIEASGRTLLNLLNDLLDLAKLESGRMRFDFMDADLRVIIESVIDEFSGTAREKAVRIDHPWPDLATTMVLDAERVKQVVRNLLSNAVKFSPRKGKITVFTTVQGANVRISVSDEGEGIPEAELETVFDKFIQSTKTKTGAGGTGLGLSICAVIVSAHGGRIWAENGASGGTVVSFEIPWSLSVGQKPMATSTAQLRTGGMVATI